MTSKINNFDSLKEYSILLISNDMNFTTKFKESSNNNIEHITSILNVIDFLKYDLVIVDLDFNDIKLISAVLSKNANETAVIFITTKIHNSIYEYVNNIKLKNIILKEYDLELINFLMLVTLKMDRFITFNNGYYFNLSNKSLFFNGKHIKLTLLELELLLFLIKNRKRVVSYEEIEKTVWENKKYTLHGMRNIVNKIREKTYYDFITNISKNGYIIENYNIVS